MPRDYSENTVWTRAETESLIQWLEDPENLRKIKKGSGITKKSIVTEIASQIPTKEAVKVGYKYDNLMKAYRAAAKLNNQSGWGLSERELDEGKRSLQDKLLSRCPYFFRLERILVDRPNVRPPVSYDLGESATDTAATIEQLLVAISNNNLEEEEGQPANLSQRNFGMEVGKEVEGRESMRRERDEGRLGSRAVEERMQIEIGRNERGVEILEDMREKEDDNNNYHIQECQGSQERVRGIEEEEVVVIGENTERQGTQRVGGPSPSPSQSSAIRGSRKRRFPEMLSDDGDNCGASSGGQRKRKGGSNALIEAVGILASAKAEGEERKFEFLNRHLVQQGELRQREIELEREKLEVEREKARGEQRRTELLILQLGSTIGKRNTNNAEDLEELNWKSAE